MTKDGGGGSASPQGSSATMRVDPEAVIALRKELSAIRDDVQNFLDFESDGLIVSPPGADPVSVDTADALSANADAAVAALRGYATELDRLIESLVRAEATYGLVDEANAESIRRLYR